MFKKITSILAALLFTVSTSNSAEFINILTGGTSGVYYPLGVGISKIYSEKIKDAKVQVQATKASVENLNLLQDGKGELAFVLGDALKDAWQGNEDAGFKTKLDKLRVIGAIYPNYIQIVASKDSKIKTLADLKGKGLSVGAAKSGTELNTRALFKAAGMSYKDLGKIEYLPYAESVELIKNRQLDATLQSAGLGVASLKDLSTSLDIVVVSVPAEIVKKMGAPFVAAKIPANTYKGQTEDVNTASVINYLVTRKDVSEATAYQMTKLFYESLPEMIASHSAAKDISLKDAANNSPVPLHPGAAKYYKEKGLIK
ncbi:MAG: TAXI family TRAP transporter solute-binding subunit [Alphaproteobacteria bacterium]|jgi:TRAP transporter TAXI family solute receptor|nr:TAXI family TRAP transporter solute-binding subunit [Candidatus Fonsibacter sp. PEL55]